MTELVVRRLLIDLETPFARHWCGGDAFRSALFNALSMSFPVGEQFFIDAVRDGHKALPVDKQAQFADEVRGFIGQEATHRRIHALFNGHLDRQGLTACWRATPCCCAPCSSTSWAWAPRAWPRAAAPTSNWLT